MPVPTRLSSTFPSLPSLSHRAKHYPWILTKLLGPFHRIFPFSTFLAPPSLVTLEVSDLER